MSGIDAVSVWIMLLSYIIIERIFFLFFRLWPHFALLTTVFWCLLNKQCARINRFTSGSRYRWAVPGGKQKQGMALVAIMQIWWRGSWAVGCPTTSVNVFFRLPIRGEIKTFCLLLWKKLINSKVVPKAASEFSFRFPCLSLADFCVRPLLDAGKIRVDLHAIGGFRIYFQDHRRFPEPFL